jgi:galactose-1-phosphate uridylyltransferase
MSQQLDRETLTDILQAENVQDLSLRDLIRLFREEGGTADFLPDGVWEIDPRDGDRILFNSSRARRPHDNLPTPASAPKLGRVCAICQGHTTGVIDVADLSEGFTFINKNLYPILSPGDGTSRRGDVPSRREARGLHFLQWTSSLHDKDWHNMPPADCAIVMRRLAALERTLLTGCGDLLPPSEPREGRPDDPGFVLIVKNYGRLVGGSLAHGHQQIVLSNVVPRRMLDNWRFEKERGEKFSAFLMRENPTELLIRDYGPAVLVVPYFMRRPYDMMLLVKDASKKHLHELTEAEITAVAAGWHDGVRAMHWIMPEIGKEIAYNVITNNGPGAGLYFEFLPYVQEIGGAEHLGLFVSQGNPESAATRIRGYLERQASET